MNLKDQRIEVNNIRLNVMVHGEGPDILLLHGFPDSSVVWRNQIDPLVQAGYRVIVPDLRGSGESDAPYGKINYSLNLLVKDVVDLMDHLKVAQAHVIGHDWGAILGWFLAIGFPKRVNRYVAMSVGHPLSFRHGGFEQKWRSWYVYAFQPPFIPEIIVKAFNWLLMRSLTRNHPELSRWKEDKSRPGRLTAGINWYRANIGRIFLGDIGRVKAPVLGIWSRGDIFLSEQQMIMSAQYVDAPWQYERFENSSHWIQLDEPKRLNKLLIQYLGQNFG